MITVCFFFDATKEEILGFTSDGHGDSIACAEISAITQTAMLGLLAHLPKTQEPKVGMDDDGHSFCIIPSDLNEKDRQAAYVILSTACWGIRAIEKEKPDEIKLVMIAQIAQGGD